MTHLYRLSSSRYPAASGMGALVYGGRWNAIGSQAIYTAESRSLAALEVLVHFQVIPQDFVLTEILLPAESSLMTLERGNLPNGWNSETITPLTQRIGELWIKEAVHLVLSVPSTIIPEERNFVINPKHPDFPRMQFGKPQPFRFDKRLAGKTLS